MDKFICVRDENLHNELLASGLKLMFEQYINGEKVYVFINEPHLVKNFSLSKEQFFTTNKLFF